jgi:hypothetical protein
VKPFQPPGLWQAVLGMGEWRNGTGDAVHRRGLYTYWKRGVPYPSAMVFDAAKRETCAVNRPRTTTPLQALVTLNDPVYVEAGKALGLRMHKDGGKDDDARLAFGFRLVTSRAPDADELAILRRLLADQRAHYADKVDQAKLLLGIKEPKGKGKAGGKAAAPDAKAKGKGKDAKPGANAGDAAVAEAPAKPSAEKAAAPAPAAKPGSEAGQPKAEGEAKNGEAPDDAKPGDGESSEAKPGDAKQGDAKPGEAKSGEAKPGDAKPSEAKAGDAAPAAAAAKAAVGGKLDPAQQPAEAAAWAQIGCTLLNLEAAIRRG